VLGAELGHAGQGVSYGAVRRHVAVLEAKLVGRVLVLKLRRQNLLDKVLVLDGVADEGVVQLVLVRGGAAAVQDPDPVLGVEPDLEWSPGASVIQLSFLFVTAAKIS